MIYEYIIIEKRTKKEKEEGKVETLLTNALVMAAEVEETVKTKAIMDNMDSIKAAGADPSKVEVLVRPFS